MDTYVLDTNLFFNMEAKLGIGDTSEKIIKNITLALRANKFMIYISPLIKAEIESFFENPVEGYLVNFFGSVKVKTPELGKNTLSAETVSNFIDDSRGRAFRGMKVAEEEIIKTGEQFMGKESLQKKEFQISIGKIISNFRERFRTATRTGTIDSVADLELIVLAKELGGSLVSTDEGLMYWGRKFGITEASPTVFGKKIQECL